MNWLQDNPLGRALVYFSGGLLFLAVMMTVVWSLPVSVDSTDFEADESAAPDVFVAAREIASLKELQVINERPLFNEDRLPAIADVDAGNDDDVDPTVAVTGAPDVKLTGVIITPDMKIATLTPSGQGQDNVMAHEGESLIGEYVGWKVGEVKPRTVVLVSNDGQKLTLELQVHDMVIKEPPKPVVAAAAAAVATAEVNTPGAPPLGEDGQPLSRAEQIRQRIAERREELRREQEARAAQAQSTPPASSANASTSRRPVYQDAVRNMMNSRKDKDSDDDTDG